MEQFLLSLMNPHGLQEPREHQTLFELLLKDVVLAVTPSVCNSKYLDKNLNEQVENITVYN